MNNNLIFIKSVFDKINENNVNYCHWKSTDHLDASFKGETDFDILVDRSDTFKLESILNNIGFIRARTPDLRTYPCVEDYVYYDSKIQKWYHFHLHNQLPCGDRWVKSYHLPIEKFILENKVYLEEYSIFNIDPMSEYLFFIVRMHMKWRLPMRKKSFVKENEYLRKRASGSSYDLKLHPLFFDEIKPIYKLLKQGIYNVSYSKQYCLKRKLKQFRRMNKIFFNIIAFIRYIYRVNIETQRRLFNKKDNGRRSLINGGKLVAFIGMDGSGKSTMLDLSATQFSKQINVAKVFLGTGRSGSHPLRRLIFKLADFLPVRKKNKIGKVKDTVTKPSLAKLIWIYLCLRDRKAELNKMKRGVANGSLVLVDRWPQSIIENVADYPKLSNFSRSSGLTGYLSRLEFTFYEDLKAYEPDLLLWFDIDPKTSLVRKPGELDIDEAAFYKDSLEKYTDDCKFNFYRIDAEKTLSEVSDTTNSLLWKVLSE
ncbi:hypothetical protein [Vibrio chagasii]|uniref:hypothetical protein n=1 Tax=Vibrio chagasii TaxID=170679 RepID=UPI003378E813|nr:conserved hypothetical protein [Vibrio chagasii]